jgi:hypothetical protein
LFYLFSCRLAFDVCAVKWKKLKMENKIQPTFEGLHCGQECIFLSIRSVAVDLDEDELKASATYTRNRVSFEMCSKFEVLLDYFEPKRFRDAAPAKILRCRRCIMEYQ